MEARGHVGRRRAGQDGAGLTASPPTTSRLEYELDQVRAAARERGTVLYTVDHHRGSEENQSGWEHHDERLVDPRTGRMDTLPFFRRTIEDATLEDAVVAVVGPSTTVAAHWATPIGLLFIDGGHAFDVALADYEGWAPHVAPGGVLVFHDVFEDPAAGGQAPYEVWKRAVADGWQPASTTGSLRVLSRV